MNISGLKLAESKIQQRIAMHHDPRLNADGSMDARENIVPCGRSPRITSLKPSKRTIGGQYRHESSGFSKFKVLIYPYLPGQVFRRSLKDGTEIPILEKIGGEWFVSEGVMLSQNEMNQLRAFDGSIGLDVDAAIARKRPVRQKAKGTYHNGGKYVYRCKGIADPHDRDRVKQRRENARNQRSLLASVQIQNVKRK